MTDEHRHPLRRANVDRAKAQDARHAANPRACLSYLRRLHGRDELRPVRLQLELLPSCCWTLASIDHALWRRAHS